MAKEMQIVITAADRASTVFNTVANNASAMAAKMKVTGGSGTFLQGIKQANLEARQSGEMGFERVLRGGGAAGGAVMIFEGITKGAGAAGEAMTKLANGEISGSQALGEFMEKTAKSVPILSQFVEGFSVARDGMEDYFAAQLKLAGFTGLSDMVKSESTRMKEAAASAKLLKDATEELHKTMFEASNIGASPHAKATNEENERFDKFQAENQKARQEAEKDHSEAGQQAVHVFQAAAVNEQKNHRAILARIDAEYDQEETNRLQAHLTQITGIRAAAHVSILRDAGLSEAADAERAQQDYARQRQTAEAARAASAMKDPANAAKFQKEFNATDAALQVERNGKVAQSAEREVEIRERTHQQLINMATQAGAEILRIGGNDDAAKMMELKAAGKAELDELENQHNAKMAAMRALGKNETDADVENEQKNYLDKRDAMAALQSAREEAENIRHQEARRDFNNQTAALGEEAAATLLRMQHRDTEARMLELQTANKHELDEMEHQQQLKEAALRQAGFGEGSAAFRESRLDYNTRRNATFDEQAAKVEAEKQRNAENQQDRNASFTHEIVQDQIQQLQEQALLGDRAADIEAKKLSILDQQAKKREDIQKQLRDETTLTDAQRKILNDQLAGLDKQTASRLANVGAMGRPDLATARGFAPQFEEDTGTSALAERQAEAMANMGGPDDKLNEINKNIESLAGALGADGWLASFLNGAKNSADNRPNPQPVF